MRRVSNLLAMLVCATAFGQSPPTPTIDTNAVEVGTVNVAWNPVIDPDDPIAGYNVYLGTNSNQLEQVATVGSTNATVPLSNYGTNWISVTSFDWSGLESDQAAPISYSLVSLPPTNVVTVSLLLSTNATQWTFLQSLFTLTNPPGNRFYKLSITNQTQ